MRSPRSILGLLPLLCVLALLGCSGSHYSARDASIYDAEAVRRSLEMNGFDVEVFDPTAGDELSGPALALLDLFSDAEGFQALVADTSPDGAIGGEVSAWIFDTVDHADLFQAGNASRLQRSNVVVLAYGQPQAAAKNALDDLG